MQTCDAFAAAARASFQSSFGRRVEALEPPIRKIAVA
jgi:hypothetical protein